MKGPWYIGYLTDGYFGSIFLWGIIIKGFYLPPDAQTLVGFIQVTKLRRRKKELERKTNIIIQLIGRQYGRTYLHNPFS